MTSSRHFAIHRFFPVALLLPLLLLTGCTLVTTATDAPVPGTALRGTVYGGQQRVVGAHVYLMAATVSGVGSAGYGLASTSLLNAALTGNSDSIGAYVLTDSNGAFSLDTVSGTTTYFYTCPSATTQVYLYVLGGNPGAGTNSAAGFMYGLGSCGNLNSNTFVVVNEITTVATAYALAGFATDALHISIPQYASATQQTNSITDALAQTDLQNAFATINNLVNTAGNALSVTPAGNGTPTTAQVNTLGNILAACVNSTGPSSNNCNTLLNNAGSTGGGTGTIPTETATAAINLAHHPYVSSTVMSNLYGLQAASGAPFANGDTSQPNDFTISITYTRNFIYGYITGGLSDPTSLAIDASGNIWIADFYSNNVSEFSNAGVVLSGISGYVGYTGGGVNLPLKIAIDASGNAWTANKINSLSKLSSSGSPISSSGGYTGGGLNGPLSLAVDASGNVWIANNGYPSQNTGNSVSKFSGTGSPITSSSGYTGGGISAPNSVAIDFAGNAWLANYGPSGTANSLSELSNSGSPISSSSGYTGGGVAQPSSIAIDASGNAWIVNSESLSKFSSSGSPMSPGNGYTGGGLENPISLAIDGTGNVWVLKFDPVGLSEYSNTGSPISPSAGYTITCPAYTYYYGTETAIDGSGNVWVGCEPIGGGGGSAEGAISELVGAATPVVTPVVSNLLPPYSAPASKP